MGLPPCPPGDPGRFQPISLSLSLSCPHFSIEISSVSMEISACAFTSDLQMLLPLLFSCPVMSSSLRPHGLHHARSCCPSPSPRVRPNSCSLHRGCRPTISSSDALFSFRPQSFPASDRFTNNHTHFSKQIFKCSQLLYFGINFPL